MSNDFYTPTGVPQTSSQGTSAVIRNEFDLIQDGFDKLPVLTGNGNKAVVINSAGTGLTVTTGTLALAGNFATTGAYAVTLAAGAAVTLTLPLANGTLATLAGAEAFTNKTSYNKVAITAPATGATLTIADGKTLTASNTLTFTGTDGSSVAFGTGGTVAYVGSTGTVTSVAQSFTGGLISVAGSPITGAGTLALTVAGTSGGIPYFSSASTWATSAALAANALVVGGGAGAAPASITTGTGVVTALGVNTGSAGAFVVNGGALGTPSSGTVTNLTGTASININGTVGATTPASGAFTTATANSVLATSNDSGALGASGTAFSDLFLASGGVINWNAGNTTLTHSAGLLTLNGAFTAGGLVTGTAGATLTGGGTTTRGVLEINTGGTSGASGAASAVNIYGNGSANGLQVGFATSARAAGNSITLWGNSSNAGAVQITTNYAVTDGNIQIGSFTNQDTLILTAAGAATFKNALTVNGNITMGSGVTLTAASSTSGFSIGGPNSNTINPLNLTNNWLISDGGFYAFRSGTAHDFNIDMYNSGGNTNALKITQTGVVTLVNNFNLISSQNSVLAGRINNGNAGTGAATVWRCENGTHTFDFSLYGTGASAYGAIPAGGAALYTTSANLVLMADNGSGVIRFAAGGSAEDMRLASDGSLLVGTTTTGGWGTDSKIEAQTTTGAAVSGYATASGGAALRSRVDSTGGECLNFYYSTSKISYWSTNGSTSTFNNPSDARLKTVAEKQFDYSGPIKAMQMVDFNWMETGAADFGGLAQQAYEAFSDAPIRDVLVSKPETPEDKWFMAPDYYGRLALWGVKDLYAENEALKARVAALEAKVN